MTSFSTTPNFPWEKDYSIIRLPRIAGTTTSLKYPPVNATHSRPGSKQSALGSVTSPPRSAQNPALPFHRVERDKLASSMAYADVFLLNHNEINEETLLKHRWKYLHAVYFLLTSPECRYVTLESCLEQNVSYIITKEHFIMSVIHAYPIKQTFNIERALELMYSTFDIDKLNQVDWRDMLTYYTVLYHFILMREHTLELIMRLVDIHTENVQPVNEKIDKDLLVIKNYEEVIYKVILCVCIVEMEFHTLTKHTQNFIADIHNNHSDPVCINRKTLYRLFEKYGSQVVGTWRRYGWERLSSAQRMSILDLAQSKSLSMAESIIGRYKLEQALHMYMQTICRKVLVEWRLVALRETGARVYLYRKNMRYKRRFLRFWLSYSKRRLARRKRRLLADIMGTYAIKARCFLRIKIHNANYKHIQKVVGSLHKNARQFALAGTHLRNYFRLVQLRRYYHVWWNKCVAENHVECAEAHDRTRLLRKVFFPWFTYAHAEQVLMREDLIARENKIAFDRRMAEQEEAIAELLRLEKERAERIAKEEKEREEAERKRKLEEYQIKVRMEKYTEKKLILNIQRDARTQRINQEMKKMKKRFFKDWVEKEKEMLAKAKERVAAFVNNKDNLPALEMKFNTLKREFFAYPTPETKERERNFSSYRNIMFLYIEYYLLKTNKTVEDIILEYDGHKKGFVNFAELTKFIRSLNTCLNEAQISSAIRSTDTSRNKEVSAQEIQHGLERIQGKMGVIGSPWKLYIDPSEDVICYHNFHTTEKILEYNMKDPVFHRIVIDDMYGLAEHNAKEDIKKEKAIDWEARMKEYMAKRLQYMYRYWKGRRYRAKRSWKIQKRLQKALLIKKRALAHKIMTWFLGFRVRKNFVKTYLLTIQRCMYVDYEAANTTVSESLKLIRNSVKLEDQEEGQAEGKEQEGDSTSIVVKSNAEKSEGLEGGVLREFYYNHHTGESSWTPPRLLQRYKVALTPPVVWVPMVGADGNSEYVSMGEMTEQMARGVMMESQSGNDGGGDAEYDDTQNALVETHTDGKGWEVSLPSATHLSSGYFHLPSRRTLPFKPDGFPLCSICQINIAVHTCKQCHAEGEKHMAYGDVYELNTKGYFCYQCHRSTHLSPFGFFQCTKATHGQSNNSAFIHQYHNSKHTYTDTKPHLCSLCQGRSKCNAAYVCWTCGAKKMCRMCFRRIHSHASYQDHTYQHV